MRIPSLRGRSAETRCLKRLCTIAVSLYTTSVTALTFDPIPAPNLDLSSLGRVALTGDFDAISLYSFKQQSENAPNSVGTQSLISQLPNGDYESIARADGYIKTMCPFVMSDGTLAGIVLGGNFTSLGGVAAQAVALYDIQKGQVTPLPGLNGSVNTVLCDQENNAVFVGGQFKAGNSTNAVTWVGMTGWTTLPFEGFNGPINSIVKSGNKTIVFGGAFSGIGNKTAPAKKDQQVINISSANLTSAGTTSRAGLEAESNIVCKTDGQEGNGNTWLLQDDIPGWWRADMNFGYEPTMLRLWNTHYEGRGTKTFRFTAIPNNGIMNLSYVDPETGKDEVCDALCPLSADSKIKYQDFRFVNTIGMSAFRIDISEWYGAGAGLNGIQLFQDDIFAYAEQGLNEPTCAGTDFPSRSTVTGPWKVMPSAQSQSRYLGVTVDGSAKDVSVVFQPDVRQQGNYSVTVFTPGCIQDNSCDRRAVVSITGLYTTGGSQIQSEIYQTNNYDKYDEIYRGPVDVNSGSFRPSVTLAPMTGGDKNAMFVAQRIQFNIDGNSTNALNGLYEWNPRSAAAEDDFTASKYDTAGADLSSGAIINSMASIGSTSYVVGNFSNRAAGIQNVLSVGEANATALADGGLNSQVSTVLASGSMLYLGGTFSGTANGTLAGLSNIAAYDTVAKEWQALGTGVDGPVYSIVPISVNISRSAEQCVSVNGGFQQVNAVGNAKPIKSPGFAIWVPSRKNWLQNLKLPSQSVTGLLSAATNVTGHLPLLAGALNVQDLTASDAVSLLSNPLQIAALDVGIQSDSATVKRRKRELFGSQHNVSGIVAGLFYANNNLNITILGGHFTGTAKNGTTINNMAFMNHTNDAAGEVSGLPPGLSDDSTFLSLATNNNTLYAGGSIEGKVNGGSVNGLVVYDLGLHNFVSPQPPALGGEDVVVNVVTMPPNKDRVLVGGRFTTAGSLTCPSVCIYENGAWRPPGGPLSGTVTSFMWQGNTKVLVGGNMTVANNDTYLATYDTDKSEWSTISSAASNAAGAIPGPITAITPASNDASKFWVTGKSKSNSSTFLVKYDGQTFTPATPILGPGTSVHAISVFNKDGASNSDGPGNALVPRSMSLLVTGQLNIPGFGNASAALYNGSAFTPFILSTTTDGRIGSISQLFSEKQVSFKNEGGPLATGFVVLIALACALGAIFLLVVAGILIERYRRRQEGYTVAPTYSYFEKGGATGPAAGNTNVDRIPPEQLFGNIGHGQPNAPMI